MNGGAWPAFFVQLGAILTALALGAAVLVGVAPLLKRPGVQLALHLFGAGVLLWLAWSALRDARRLHIPLAAQGRAHHSLIVGAICAVSNPLTVMVWFAVGGVATGHGFTELHARTAIIGLGYLMGTLTWAVLFAACIGWGRRWFQSRVWRWWNLASGLLFTTAGLHLLWQTLREVSIG